MNHLRLLLPPADRPSSLRLLFLLHLFLLLLLFVLPPCRCDDSQIYTECRRRPPTCGGESFNISYPFVMSTDPPYCGHPDFHLSCDEENALTISIMEKQYKVLGIDYDNHSFTIADAESFPAGSCFWPSENLTLDPFLFPIDTVLNLNVTFLNCSRPNPNPILTYFSSPCLPGAPDSLYYYWSKDNSFSNDAAYQCRLVQFPISKAALNHNNVSDALLKGFALDWAEGIWKDCGVCLNSNGVCVSDESEEHVACYHCPDGMLQPDGSCPYRRDDVESGKKSGRETVTIVGSCVGAVAFIAVTIVLGLLLYRRRDRKQLSSILLSSGSQVTSFEPSSKKDEDVVLELGQYPATKLFQYEELHEATDGFSESNELGDGGFGTVYKGTLRDGRTVAIKRLYENNYRRVEQFRTEVHILSSLRHPFLVGLYGCTSRHSRELLLVYEYIPNGTVADHLHGNLASEQGLPWRTRMSIAIETAEALGYLHAVTPPIIHRDVKTNNILLDSDFHVKVADFGLSRLFPANATHVSTAPQGTPGYVDPEYHQCYQLTDKSDVYSFGVVLAELISSRPAVDISRPREEINLANMALSKIQNDQVDQLVDAKLRREYSSVEVVWMINHVAEVAFRCLQPEREARPTMKEVLDALRGIEEEVCNRAATDEEKDHVSLLVQDPNSPDTVAAKWESRKTTPSPSG